MGKNGILMVLAMTSVFFLACQGNEEVYSHMENALKSMSKVVVKYHSEFEQKVKFIDLQKAIDAIAGAMAGYQGTAARKFQEIQRVNQAARLPYLDCVGPVFEWCTSMNSTIGIFMSHINDEHLSPGDRKVMWSMTVVALHSGLFKTLDSLRVLDEVQSKTAELKNLFDSIVHDVHDDFSASGYYGREEQRLRQAVSAPTQTIDSIFIALGGMAFGPIGIAIGLPLALHNYHVRQKSDWERKKTYQEKLEAIKQLCSIINEKIGEASKIVREANEQLEEDRTNLYALRGRIEAADTTKQLLSSDNQELRSLYIPSLRSLGQQCYSYTMWHGFRAQLKQYKCARARRHATELGATGDFNSYPRLDWAD
ncbi:hypothetical protein KR009_011239 [Drosophila setifemur]|nr:hypothetical protein KR009_011239 [Drosophila setifemur]